MSKQLTVGDLRAVLAAYDDDIPVTISVSYSFAEPVSYATYSFAEEFGPGNSATGGEELDLLFHVDEQPEGVFTVKDIIDKFGIEKDMFEFGNFYYEGDHKI